MIGYPREGGREAAPAAGGGVPKARPCAGPGAGEEVPGAAGCCGRELQRYAPCGRAPLRLEDRDRRAHGLYRDLSHYTPGFAGSRYSTHGISPALASSLEKKVPSPIQPTIGLRELRCTGKQHLTGCRHHLQHHHFPAQAPGNCQSPSIAHHRSTHPSRQRNRPYFSVLQPAKSHHRNFP